MTLTGRAVPLVLLLLAACGGSGVLDAATDSGGGDSAADGGPDAGRDSAATDATMDATSDADVRDTTPPIDATLDADATVGADASSDAASDAVVDAVADTAVVDADPDAAADTGSGVFTPVCRFELDGVSTVHEASAYLTRSGPFIGVACDSAVASFRIGLRVDAPPEGTYACGAATMGAMSYNQAGTTWGANAGTGSASSPCTIIIDALGGGRAQGTFSGTLVREIGTGTPTTRMVTNGEFDVRF